MSELGNKEIIANNIEFYMNLYKKSRMDMCRLLDVSYSTFADWVNAKKYPRIDKIEMMARIFNVKKSDLVEKPTEKKNKFLVPVFGDVSAGVPLEAVENIIDYEEISEEMARAGEHFGLRIKGDSMEPKFSSGDVVIVRKQEQVENGQIAVVMINGDDATVKKFYKTDANIMLVGTNPSFVPLTYTPEQVEQLPVRVIGRVVELRAKF